MSVKCTQGTRYPLQKAPTVTQSLCFRPESTEKVTKLLERNRALQDENNKLSRELSEAAGQTALMFEKIIMVSQTVNTFTEPLTDGKTVTSK